MKKQAVCEYCGKVFEERINEENYYNYKQDCVEHEITHLPLAKDFEFNLSCALNELDEKYDSESNILKIDISACWESYYGRDITYDFKIENTKIKNIMIEKIEVPYESKEKIPTKEEIMTLLEQHYFIPTIQKEYKGTVSFEDYCGGLGADDYMIGDLYVKDIFHELKGKNIKINIID